MLYALITQWMLTASFMPFFPSDAGQVERQVLQQGEPRTFPIAAEVFRSVARLPVAQDIAPKKIRPNSLGVITSAESATVVDARSGAVLFEKNRQESRAIGSMTKLMTALVFLREVSDLDAPATLLPDDERPGGREHLVVGDQYRVRDLLAASLISSDNSATMALVRISGLSAGDFVARMNERAAEIGMQQTTFADPTGLSVDNRSVASDLVLLLRAALSQPDIRELTQHASAEVTGISGRVYPLEATNELLDGPLNQEPYAIIGGKTGFLPEAGYCLGVEVQKDGQTIYVVVLGSKTLPQRFSDVMALSVWAFETFSWSAL